MAIHGEEIHYVQVMKIKYILEMAIGWCNKVN